MADCADVAVMSSPLIITCSLRKSGTSDRKTPYRPGRWRRAPRRESDTGLGSSVMPLVDPKAAAFDPLERLRPKRQIQLGARRSLSAAVLIDAEERHLHIVGKQPVLRRELKPSPSNSMANAMDASFWFSLNGAAWTEKARPPWCKGALSASRSSADVLLTAPLFASRVRRTSSSRRRSAGVRPRGAAYPRRAETRRPGRLTLTSMR